MAAAFLDSTFGWTPGFGQTALVITLAYQWLPYMVLPIYAGLDRLPASLLDAPATSADARCARSAASSSR